MASQQKTPYFFSVRRSISSSGERGSALVESAISIPVIFIILIGLFDIGGLTYNFLIFKEIVGEAAKVAARVPGLTGTETSDTSSPPVAHQQVFDRINQMVRQERLNERGMFPDIPVGQEEDYYRVRIVREDNNVRVELRFAYKFMFSPAFRLFSSDTLNFYVDETVPYLNS